MKTTYSARGNAVFADPKTRTRADGSTSTSMGFLVCEVAEDVHGDDSVESPARLIARTLTHFDGVVEALSQAATELVEAAKLIRPTYPISATLFDAAACRAMEIAAAARGCTAGTEG